MTHTRDINTALEIAGLEQNEAAVYRALLKLGQTGAAAIGREAGLHGQIVYRALDRLEELDLINRTSVNGRYRFTAYAPSRIVAQYEARGAALREMVEELEHVHTPPLADSIQVYQGRDQFVAQEFELIRGMSKDSMLYVITGTADQYEKVLGNRLIEYDHIKTKRNITMRLICPEEQRRVYATTDRPLIEYRTLPQQFTGDINIGIYSDTLGMYMFTEPVSSIIIHNASVAQSYKNFFEALWKMGK
jgi:sugar-specific transcriptional regulator TrmB